jgi:hypothetical protein
MTPGEQMKALSKLTTYIIVTFGTAGGTTSTLTRTLGGLEATVPVLSLSAKRCRFPWPLPAPAPPYPPLE